jgi:hypothetical protein
LDGGWVLVLVWFDTGGLTGRQAVDRMIWTGNANRAGGRELDSSREGYRMDATGSDTISASSPSARPCSGPYSDTDRPTDMAWRMVQTCHGAMLIAQPIISNQGRPLRLAPEWALAGRCEQHPAAASASAYA